MFLTVVNVASAIIALIAMVMVLLGLPKSKRKVSWSFMGLALVLIFYLRFPPCIRCS